MAMTQSLLAHARSQGAAVAGHKLQAIDQRIASFGAFPAALAAQIHVLLLSTNLFSSLEGVEQFMQLQVLSLANNLLTYTDDLRPLGRLPGLRRLFLTGNAVTVLPHYRVFVLCLCPSLAWLDGHGVEEVDRVEARASQRQVDLCQLRAVHNEIRNALLRHMLCAYRMHQQLRDVALWKMRCRPATDAAPATPRSAYDLLAILRIARASGVYDHLLEEKAETSFAKHIQRLILALCLRKRSKNRSAKLDWKEAFQVILNQQEETWMQHLLFAADHVEIWQPTNVDKEHVWGELRDEIEKTWVIKSQRNTQLMSQKTLSAIRNNRTRSESFSRGQRKLSQSTMAIDLKGRKVAVGTNADVKMENSASLASFLPLRLQEPDSDVDYADKEEKHRSGNAQVNTASRADANHLVEDGNNADLLSLFRQSTASEGGNLQREALHYKALKGSERSSLEGRYGSASLNLLPLQRTEHHLPPGSPKSVDCYNPQNRTSFSGGTDQKLNRRGLAEDEHINALASEVCEINASSLGRSELSVMEDSLRSALSKLNAVMQFDFQKLFERWQFAQDLHQECLTSWNNKLASQDIPIPALLGDFSQATLHELKQSVQQLAKGLILVQRSEYECFEAHKQLRQALDQSSVSLLTTSQDCYQDYHNVSDQVVNIFAGNDIPRDFLNRLNSSLLEVEQMRLRIDQCKQSTAIAQAEVDQVLEEQDSLLRMATEIHRKKELVFEQIHDVRNSLKQYKLMAVLSSHTAHDERNFVPFIRRKSLSRQYLRRWMRFTEVYSRGKLVQEVFARRREIRLVHVTWKRWKKRYWIKLCGCHLSTQYLFKLVQRCLVNWGGELRRLRFSRRKEAECIRSKKRNGFIGFIVQINQSRQRHWRIQQLEIYLQILVMIRCFRSWKRGFNITNHRHVSLANTLRLHRLNKLWLYWLQALLNKRITTNSNAKCIENWREQRALSRSFRKWLYSFIVCQEAVRLRTLRKRWEAMHKSIKRRKSSRQLSLTDTWKRIRRSSHRFKFRQWLQLVTVWKRQHVLMRCATAAAKRRWLTRLRQHCKERRRRQRAQRHLLARARRLRKFQLQIFWNAWLSAWLQQKSQNVGRMGDRRIEGIAFNLAEGTHASWISSLPHQREDLETVHPKADVEEKVFASSKSVVALCFGSWRDDYRQNRRWRDNCARIERKHARSLLSKVFRFFQRSMLRQSRERLGNLALKDGSRQAEGLRREKEALTKELASLRKVQAERSSLLESAKLMLAKFQDEQKQQEYGLIDVSASVKRLSEEETKLKRDIKDLECECSTIKTLYESRIAFRESSALHTTAPAKVVREQEECCGVAREVEENERVHALRLSQLQLLMASQVAEQTSLHAQLQQLENMKLELVDARDSAAQLLLSWEQHFDQAVRHLRREVSVSPFALE